MAVRCHRIQDQRLIQSTSRFRPKILMHRHRTAHHRVALVAERSNRKPVRRSATRDTVGSRRTVNQNDLVSRVGQRRGQRVVHILEKHKKTR